MTNIKYPNDYPKMHHFAFNSLCHEQLREIGFDPLEFEIRSLEVCESTNDFANKLLDIHNNSIVLSMVQDKGRGRESRVWYSPVGGMWLSIGINSTSKVTELSTPVIHAVKKVLDLYVETEIKPPNDIKCQGKKMCGILVETKSVGDRFQKIIIGIGINVFNEIPEEIMDIATRLSDYVDAPSVPELASKIATSVLSEIKNLIYE